MQKTKVTSIPTSAIVDLSAATGPVTIKMTNDYLFRHFSSAITRYSKA